MQFHQFLTKKEPLKIQTFEELQYKNTPIGKKSPKRKENRKLMYYKENMKTNFIGSSDNYMNNFVY